MDNVNRILSGDHKAFKQWMDIHIHHIERFAVQYGVTPEEAGKVAEKVFGNLFLNLSQLTEEQLEEKSLYKTALQKLDEYHVKVSKEGLFSFAEDNELHACLIVLPKEERIAFILDRFHEKSEEDIAWIMEKQVENVHDYLQKAQAKLDGPDIEKRCEFLNKSFHRIRPSFDERNIFYSETNEEVRIDEPINRVSRTKKPLYLWLIGSVMLILILSVTVVRSDAYQQSSAEKYIENKKNSFQQELNDRLELIGLDQPNEEEVDRFLEFYTDHTKMAYTRFIATLEDQLKKDGKIDRKAANQTYESLTQQLRLPSEMIEELKENPKTDNRKESADFVEELFRKLSFVMNVYMMTLSEHEAIISSAELNDAGIVDIDRFLAKKFDYPIKLQKAIDGMATQSVYLTAPIHPKYGTPEVLDVLQQNLHPDMKIYIYMLTGESNLVAYSDSIEEKIEALSYIEQELPKTKKTDGLHHYVDNEYIWLFHVVTGVYESGGSISDQNLSIKPEIRERWKSIASRDENTMAVQIMRELVTEMEEQNWTASKEYEVEQSLSQRLHLKIREAREGNK